MGERQMTVDPHNLGPIAYKYEDVITEKDLLDWSTSMYAAEREFYKRDKISIAEAHHTLHVAFEVLQLWLADGKARDSKTSSIYKTYLEIFKQLDEGGLL